MGIYHNQRSWRPETGDGYVRPPVKVYSRRNRIRPNSCGPTSVNEVL